MAREDMDVKTIRLNPHIHPQPKWYAEGLKAYVDEGLRTSVSQGWTNYYSAENFDTLRNDYKNILRKNYLVSDLGAALKIKQKGCEILVLRGKEVRSKEGHVLALCFNGEIDDGLSLEDTILEIDTQRGIAILPHPTNRLFKGAGAKNIKLLHRRGLLRPLEINSANVGPFKVLNDYTKKLAARYELPYTVGSDAKRIEDIGLAYVEIDLEHEDLTKNKMRRAIQCALYSELRSKHSPLKTHFQYRAISQVLNEIINFKLEEFNDFMAHRSSKTPFDLLKRSC